MFRAIEAGLGLAVTLWVLHAFAPQVFDLVVGILVDVLTLLQQVIHNVTISGINTNTISAL